MNIQFYNNNITNNINTTKQIQISYIVIDELLVVFEFMRKIKDLNKDDRIIRFRNEVSD